MSFLLGIFNPTILIFLSVVLLITALLIVYFETKMREQNHKISSMLSLVSSLAEETNKIKYHLTHNVNAYTYHKGSLDNDNSNQTYIQENSLEKTLIDVSDDEDDEEHYNDDINDEDADDDIDDSSDDSNDSDDDSDNDSSDDSNDNHDIDDDTKKNITINEVSENDIKILNLDKNDFYDIDDNNDDDINDDVDDDDLEDIDFNELTDNDSFNEKANIKNQDQDNDIVSNVKSISILHLEEEKNKNVEVIDYKKFALNKLKAIVLEKGLVADSSKLKKPELLKLLNAE